MKTMKKILLVFAGILAFCSVHAQQLVKSINAASYYAQDSTTFYFGVPNSTTLIIVEFTGLDEADATVNFGHGTYDQTIFVSAAVTGNPFTMDNTDADNLSWVKLDGTKTEKYVLAVGAERWRGSYLTLNIIWGSVESGTINVYY